ncbi:CAP domain-containing protein [Sphingomonas sp. JC676]|nr:CAP domain-containing protein [Sphingomonas sp. JC676]
MLTAASDGPPSLEDDVLARINFVRQHPREYAEQLRDYRRYFVGSTLYLPGDANGVTTREGTAAVDEAIGFLERQAPLPPLGRGALLELAAQDHVAALGPIGGRGHVSPDGASPGERVRRRGGDIYVGEDISYGYSDADAVVRQLIVDDGVRDRAHRALLFNIEVRYAGVGCGAHQRYGHMCVVDMSRTINGRSVSDALASNGPAFRTSATAR